MRPSPSPKTKTAAADRDADSDGDGMLNWQEYVVGTDPANALSYLKIDSITEGVGATLAFGAISNKTYSIQYTDAFGRQNIPGFAFSLQTRATGV
jgi:hypothetical protein